MSEFLLVRQQRARGGYVEWKEMEATNTRILFLLDHCSPDEQRQYLKEFDTVELANFLYEHVHSLSEAELGKLSELELQYHALPGLNALMGFTDYLRLARVQSDPICTDLQKLRQKVAGDLKKKLKEIEWKRIDAEMDTTTKEVQLK